MKELPGDVILPVWAIMKHSHGLFSQAATNVLFVVQFGGLNVYLFLPSYYALIITCQVMLQPQSVYVLTLPSPIYDLDALYISL